MPKKTPTPKPKTPKYRHHKATNQGFVELCGRRIYLGRYDLPETEQRYHATVSEWLARGRRLPVEQEEITVLELVARYAEHCESYYRKAHGGVSAGYEAVQDTTKALCAMYGGTKATEFSPLKLQALREQWINRGLARTTINNKRVVVVKRLFKWAVSQELIPASVSQALDCVEGLRKGRSAAKEGRKVSSVPQAHIDAVKPFVSRQVWGLIRVQLLTGARSSEVLKLRRIDLDTSGTIWTCRLDDHKTAYADKVRTLYFGPEAQSVLREFFPGKGPTDYLFSPVDAERERREKQHADRTTPLSCGNVPGSNRKDDPTVKPGEHYTPASYRSLPGGQEHYRKPDGDVTSEIAGVKYAVGVPTQFTRSRMPSGRVGPA